MNVRGIVSHTLSGARVAALSLAMLQLSVGPVLAQTVPSLPTPAFSNDTPSPGTLGNPVSPIKHVIVIIGENRSFDHVFATYQPKSLHGAPQHVHNLLSEGIVAVNPQTKVASPGPNYYKAVQNQGVDTAAEGFLLSPPQQPYTTLPNPLAGGPSGAQANLTGYCGLTAAQAAAEAAALGLSAQLEAIIQLPCATVAAALESGLESADYASLGVGGTGLAGGTPDTRIQWAGRSVQNNNLLPGPFQLTSATLPYLAYAASPVHRFYQMTQQLDCSLWHASWENPSGCDGKLFAWVETTFGAGSNGAAQPANFATNYTTGETPAPATTGEGSAALGFYNVQQGDAPYLKSLADQYAMSDNFHQSVQGGTGANHIMLGHGDAIWFDDNGNTTPPPNEIENPNPVAGTNNWWSEDGYGSNRGGTLFGGSYSQCADHSQPGVGPVVSYLRQLHIDPRCEAGHYYLLNNYNPGYEPAVDAKGNHIGYQNAYHDTNPSNTPFTVTPSTTRSIGDSLLAADISWKYYGDQWNIYQTDPYEQNSPAKGQLEDAYCTICNPFQYDTSIMSNPTTVQQHIQDSVSLYADIQNGNLPAVSFVKPSGLVDGHPASSKLDLFEGFSKKIVDLVQASAYAKDTAIFITFDEGGGYYDSGYVQPVDFFGDGTRIPFIVVAPYLKGPGYVSHQYADHVSILKFIERNWRLQPVTHRSRDNFPNPVQPAGAYAPVNTPALDDLFDFFSFPAAGPGGFPGFPGVPGFPGGGYAGGHPAPGGFGPGGFPAPHGFF